MVALRAAAFAALRAASSAPTATASMRLPTAPLNASSAARASGSITSCAAVGRRAARGASIALIVEQRDLHGSSSGERGRRTGASAGCGEPSGANFPATILKQIAAGEPLRAANG